MGMCMPLGKESEWRAEGSETSDPSIEESGLDAMGINLRATGSQGKQRRRDWSSKGAQKFRRMLKGR